MWDDLLSSSSTNYQEWNGSTLERERARERETLQHHVPYRCAAATWEEQEQEAGLARVPSQGDGKSAKQLAREKKERQRKAATARLKAERMELAIRAGRTLVALTHVQTE